MLIRTQTISYNLIASSHRRHVQDKTVLSCFVCVGGVNNYRPNPNLNHNSSHNLTSWYESVWYELTRVGFNRRPLVAWLSCDGCGTFYSGRTFRPGFISVYVHSRPSRHVHYSCLRVADGVQQRPGTPAPITAGAMLLLLTCAGEYADCRQTMHR